MVEDLSKFPHLIRKDIQKINLKNMPHKNKAVANKIKKIMSEGIRGKKVSQKQAVAVAYSMEKKHKKKWVSTSDGKMQV